MISEQGGTVTRELHIAELLMQINSGQLVLPEFQRDFDWGDDRVVQLLATIIRRWPAGSLLLQELPDQTFFKLRRFDGGPPIRKAEAKFVALDGQQRLTALYHAVYDTGAYVYAIRGRALELGSTIDLIEDNIASFSRTEWDSDYRNEPWTESNDWIPFYALKSAADFFLWRDEAIRRAPDDDKEQVAQGLSECYRFGLERFHSYMLPAVVVDQGLEPAAIARIFERVNRGGLRLSAFDLMVAKTFEKGWNLRDRWEAACQASPSLANAFGDDGMPIIRTIALRQRASVREADVLRLEGPAVRRAWDDAVLSVSEALDLLQGSCGLLKPEWLPYGGMLISLAGITWEYQIEQEDPLLQAWFFSSAFGLRYENAANTVTVEEFESLSQHYEDAHNFRSLPISRTVLLEATRKRRSALWRAFLCLLGVNRPLDPVSGEALSEDARPVSIFSSEERHPTGTEPFHLRIGGLVLCSPSSARLIAGQGGDELELHLGALGGHAAAVRASQLIPARGHSGPASFLEHRMDLVEDRLIELTGRPFVESEEGVDDEL